MRQYRGIRKDNGEWAKGWYLEEEDAHYNTYPVIVWGRHHEVIPETVGQSTGLLDKNGLEAYRDDIVEDIPQQLWIVAWSDEDAAFVLILAGRTIEDAYEDEIEHISEIVNMIIRGNIHTTPELLE